MAKQLILLVGIMLLAATFVAASGSNAPNLTAMPDFARNPEAKSPKANAAPETWTVLDFEGLLNFAPVGDYYPGVHFSPEWAALIDFDAGGTGNFGYEPSPDTVAFVPDADPSTPEIIPATVTFDEPVGGIGLYYASITQMLFIQPLAVELYDANGNLLATFTGSDTPIFTRGDPTGAFSEWYAMRMVLTYNNISQVRFLGGGSYWAMDSFGYMRLPVAADEDADEASDETGD